MSIFLVLGSFVLFISGVASSPALMRAIFFFFILFLWFLTRFIEFKAGASVNRKFNVRFGFGWFLVREVMFFFAFFWSFFCYSVIPSVYIGGFWGPMGVVPICPWGVPLLNTIILLRSGIRVTLAHSCVKSWNYSTSPLFTKYVGFLRLLVTIFLGCFFLCIQVIEYREAPFSLADRAFGTSFFILTGLHGLHVTFGTLLLLARASRFFSFYSERHVGLECRIWYWHFVDVVWLFLFGFVYVWRFGN